MTQVMPRRLCQHPAGSLLWAVVACAEVRPVQWWGCAASFPELCACSAGMCRLLPQLITCSTAVLLGAAGVVSELNPAPATCRHCFLPEGLTLHFLFPVLSHLSPSELVTSFLHISVALYLKKITFPEWARNLANREGDTEFFAFGVLLLLLLGLSVCTVPKSLNLQARQMLDPLLIHCPQLITQVD